MSAEIAESASVGLVLSGGGVRGAYEAGVLSGIVEVLGLRPSDASPFGILAGSSVGAIHAAFVAGHSQRGDLSVSLLEDAWRSLELTTHLRIGPLKLFLSGSAGPRRALLDVRPLENLVRSVIPFRRIRQNVANGYVRALFVAALQVATGRTTVFSQVAPGARYVPSRDWRRTPVRTAIGSEHVLASASLPLLFPPRRIGHAYYCDGGLRFNTPIAPAIRAGAKRLVIVAPFEPFQATSVPGASHHRAPPIPVDIYPSPHFLLGKLLDVLLLDPTLYDLQLLDRYNQLVAALERELPPQSLEKVHKALVAMRGAPYCRVETLLFTPSEDIARLAAERLRALVHSSRTGRALARAFRRAGPWTGEADWASYLLFDGEYAGALIELGKSDARTRAREIRRFFASKGRARRPLRSEAREKRGGR